MLLWAGSTFQNILPGFLWIKLLWTIRQWWIIRVVSAFSNPDDSGLWGFSKQYCWRRQTRHRDILYVIYCLTLIPLKSLIDQAGWSLHVQKHTQPKCTPCLSTNTQMHQFTLLKKTAALLFIEHLLHTRHCSGYLTRIISFKPQTSLWDKHYYSHFTEEKTEAQRRKWPAQDNTVV